MRTITPGAARRRETAEAVRERMQLLLPADDETELDTAEEAEGWLLTSRQASPGPPDPGPPPAAESPPAESPPARVGWWTAVRLHPALALDRRAVLGLAVLLLLAVGYAVQHFWLGRPRPVPIPVATPAPASAVGPVADPASPEPGSPVVVDIAGKVHSPGLRVLPGGSRVADALRAAGGPLPDTGTDSLNLARVLSDGEQILVGAPEAGALPGPASPRAPLSLNRATLDQLDALPGVGPALAQRILRYRQEHGGAFRSVDQLRQVGGIGDRKLQDLRPLLTL